MTNLTPPIPRHALSQGSVAYVAQEAWIQNATLKDNILFGRTLDEDLYNRCVEACALKSDFEMLPGGDKTEIGEKVSPRRRTVTRGLAAVGY